MESCGGGMVPTRDALMARAAALGAYRVGRPLLVEEMRFSRSDSAQAIALGWLAVGGPPRRGGSPTGWRRSRPSARPPGYPTTRFDDRVLGAADLLVRLSGSDPYEMGRLLAGAVPAVPPVTVSRIPGRPCGAGPTDAGPGVAHPRNSSARSMQRFRRPHPAVENQSSPNRGWVASIAVDPWSTADGVDRRSTAVVPAASPPTGQHNVVGRSPSPAK